MAHKSTIVRVAGGISLFLAMLLLVTIVSMCGPATPRPAPTPTEVSAKPTETQPPSATNTPPPAPTATEVPATPVETSVPVTTELKATVVAGMPPTPTPDGSGGDWGQVDVAVMPLQVSAGEAPLWAAYSIGMGYYDPMQGHFVAIYTHDDEGWQETSRVVLTNCAQYVDPTSLVQVAVEPSRLWLELQTYAGAHSGCYDLMSFDGETLRLEVSGFNSSPGAGHLADLDGDGLLEVILNQTENYVFCYACGVRLQMFEVLRWDGEQMVNVNLTPLPEGTPADLRQINDRAVELAQSELWKDAQATIAQAKALDIQDPELLSTVTWNAILIDLVAEARADQAQSGIYPLLENVFYGNYAAALESMRPHSPEEIWSLESPLVVGTVAEGWEMALSAWITGFTNLALQAEPDLAAAYFLRAWATDLNDPADPAALADVERAAELAPDDELFSQSLAYLADAAPAEPPTVPASFQPLPGDTCYALGQAIVDTLYLTATLTNAPFEDYVGGGFGTGCRALATGTGADLADLPTVAGELRAMLQERGWQEDVQYAADGPTGTASGFRQDGGLCLLSVAWEPSDDANCPSDQPISECDLEPEQQVYTIVLNCAQGMEVPAPTAEATPTAKATPTIKATPTTKATPTAVPEEHWEVRTLLAGPGQPGRLYALLAEMASSAWPAERIRFLVSDDYGQTWFPFPGGLPAEECVRNVNLDYATPDALYASTCQGLYRWSGGEWQLVSAQETGMVAVVYGQPEIIWATNAFASGGAVSRSGDGGQTWNPADSGLIHFNGVANLGIDPRDANTLYAVIWPKYGGSYLRRGTANGQWQTMPTPLNNVQIDSGMTIDGASGALYVTAYSSTWQLWRTLNPQAADMNDIRWEMVHDFGPDISWASLLASGWGPDGLALYANLSAWLDKPSGRPGAWILHRSLDGGQTWVPLPLP
jgi:hypothetical protein